MTKKPKEIVEVPDYETPEEEEPEIKISKRTGKPVRPLTEKQRETLAKGRELAIAKRKELLVGVDLAKRAETIQKAKEEMKNARNVKQQEKLEQQKKQYEEAVREESDEEEEEPPRPVAKPKKLKKKVIKYIEASSSESEEEVIVRRRRKEPKEPRYDNLPENILRQRMKSNLADIKSNSLASLMIPSYY